MPVLLLLAVDTLLDWMFDFKIKQPKDSMNLHCRTYSMSKILTHDCIAAGCLNKGYSSAVLRLLFGSLFSRTQRKH